MRRRTGILLAAAALGAGWSVWAGGCGEDRGSVKIEGGGTETSPTTTVPTETARTDRSPGGY